METTSFLGLECLRLANQMLELLVTQTVGPRLLRLSLVGGENILAELPDLQLECPGAGIFNLWGGHRLWHSPEVRRRTYLPDNQPLTINEIERGVEVIQPTETQTGVQKSMRITLPDEGAIIIIDHILKNEGLWPAELAPWAITQLKPGGIAILPQFVGEADPDGVQANRHLAIWPYTDMNSPHIQWGNRYIFVKATMDTGALKLGFPNPIGWLAYHHNGTLFVKKAAYQPEADYTDFGSSSECYCNPDFIELETLGPRTLLKPGESTSHQETWHLFAAVDFVTAEENIQDLVEQLGLQ